MSRWEGAESEPQPWQRPHLARLLGISAAALHDMLAAVVVLPDRADRPADRPAVMVVADDGQAGAATPGSGTTDPGGDTSLKSRLVSAGSATRDSTREQLQAAIVDAYDLDGLRRVLGDRPDFDIEDACKRGRGKGKAEVVGLLLEQATRHGWLAALLWSLRQDTGDPTLRAMATPQRSPSTP